MEISPPTQEQYRRCGEMLWRQTAKASGLPDIQLASPLDVVQFMIRKKPTWAKRTWGFYKAAQMFCLREKMVEADGELALQIREAIRVLAAESRTGAMTKGTHTSSLKAKSIKPKEFWSLIQHLEENEAKYKWARLMRLWLISAEATGLRPGEWGGAALLYSDDWMPQLRVENAKATNGRGTGQFRTLLLEGCSPEQLEAINELLDIFEGYRQDDKLEYIQGAFADYFHRTVRKVLSPRINYPSPYTWRHVFASNNKAVWSQEQVGALMGHASTETAGRNYSRACNATGRSVVRPVEAEVIKVRPVREKPFRPNKSRGPGF